MRRSPQRLSDSLSRQWIRAADVPSGVPLRVLQFNALADCLAKGFRCNPAALTWEHRGPLIEHELIRYNCDILGICEVDRYDDCLQPKLSQAGYAGTFRRKRSPAKDGVAIFWRTHGRIEEALRRSIVLGGKTKSAQVALFQRLRVGARSVVVCATHLRASADEAFRLQQAAEVASALKAFSRGDAQIVLADLNSVASADRGMSPADRASGSRAKFGGDAAEFASVLDFFENRGYRCAYKDLCQVGSYQAGASPGYTSWAGWAAGDFKGVCDHILISADIRVAAVLDVPGEQKLAAAFPERLPNSEFPSDHMSLVADLVII